MFSLLKSCPWNSAECNPKLFLPPCLQNWLLFLHCKQIKQHRCRIFKTLFEKQPLLRVSNSLFHSPAGHGWSQIAHLTAASTRCFNPGSGLVTIDSRSMGIKTNAAKTVPEGAVAIVAYFPGLVSWVSLLSVTTEYFSLKMWTCSRPFALQLPSLHLLLNEFFHAFKFSSHQFLTLPDPPEMVISLP